MTNEAGANSPAETSQPFWGSGRRPDQAGCFLEVFAGEAVLTRAVQAAGGFALPPIELIPNQFVPTPVDLTDVAVLEHLEMLIREGWIGYIHFGTPCSSFSLARKDNGGPPPLRARRALWYMIATKSSSATS